MKFQEGSAGHGVVHDPLMPKKGGENGPQALCNGRAHGLFDLLLGGEFVLRGRGGGRGNSVSLGPALFGNRPVFARGFGGQPERLLHGTIAADTELYGVVFRAGLCSALGYLTQISTRRCRFLQ